MELRLRFRPLLGDVPADGGECCASDDGGSKETPLCQLILVRMCRLPRCEVRGSSDIGRGYAKGEVGLRILEGCSRPFGATGRLRDCA